MSARVKPLDRLLGEQADASDPKRLVWLSASAGTGKTHVLTARVLRLLLSGAEPGSILCLTFTKAGAAEMADRIQARLASWVRLKNQALAKELFALGEANDDRAIRKARQLFARVLDAPGGGLRIQTIHAFAQTLLAAFPAEAGLIPGFKPLEGRAEAALARETLGRLLVDAERQGDKGLIADAQILSRRLGEEKAENYLRTCARAPAAMMGLGAREAIEARVRLALDVWLGDVEARIIEECQSFDCGGLRAIRSANLAWGTKTGLEHAGQIDLFLAANAEGRAVMLPEMIALVRTATGTPRKLSQKLIDCDPAHEGNCEALAEAVGMLLGQRTRAATAALIAAGLRAGQAYALAYAEAKRAQGVVDFDDLIRLTVELLGQKGIGEWIRYKLDARIDHVLIDEGQDTNNRQWTIVKALAEEFFVEAPGEETRKARTIFSVGDFKQAIFGFQGTDPANFADARGFFSDRARESGREVEHLSIDRSFRSTPPILTVVDKLGEVIGDGAMGPDVELTAHIAAKADGAGTVTLWQPVTAEAAGDEDDGEEGWIDDAARLFAGKLADQIKAWIDQLLWLPGKKRALRPEDVLILVRKRGDLASLIVARLHAAGVPVAGVDRLRLDAPLAVKDLMATIRFVLQPEDDLTLASLLVSPLFGLSQDDLYALAFNRKGASLWSRMLGSTHHDAIATLRNLLNSADFSTPYQFIEAILSGSLEGRRKLLSRLGDEARDPIEELLNAALLFEREATPTLQRFLDWFDRGEVEVTRDPSAPLDAVRVMTVHGAKGLQAPLVILADATGDPRTATPRGLEWKVDAAGEAVPVVRPRKDEVAGSLAEASEELARRERQEHWRLLYVAATRAEEYLVVGGSLSPRAKGIAPPESWWSAFERVMGELGVEPVADPIWNGAYEYNGRDLRRSEIRAAAAQRESLEQPLPDWLRQPAPQEARPPRPLAPSAPTEDDTPQSPPTPAMRAAARRGRLLHALFERLPAIAPEERHASALRWLKGAGGVENDNEAEGIARDVCAIIADPAFSALFSSASLAEAPIAAVLAEGIVVAGTVDRLLVEPHRIQVIDYKTSRAVPTHAEQVPTGHLRQMSAYVEALRVIFPDRLVEAALLYTAAPLLLPLPDAILARYKPSLSPAQQKLALNG